MHQKFVPWSTTKIRMNCKQMDIFVIAISGWYRISIMWVNCFSIRYGLSSLYVHHLLAQSLESSSQRHPIDECQPHTWWCLYGISWCMLRSLPGKIPVSGRRGKCWVHGGCKVELIYYPCNKHSICCPVNATNNIDIPSHIEFYVQSSHPWTLMI